MNTAQNEPQAMLLHTDPAQVAVQLEGVGKGFAGRTVLHPLSLQVFEGEFLTLLGPSGCGKSTLLQIMAGLLESDSGAVFIDTRPAAQIPPQQREIGIVGQHYALPADLSVADYLGHALRLRGASEAHIPSAVQQALAQVKLHGYDEHRGAELSAGQQQRVALARALVIRPRLLLLDDPLSALDKPLRLALQAELKDLQRKLGVTIVLVTGDQSQALSLSDRVLVMDAGHVRQVGTPDSLYHDPQHPFVASFIGGANALPGRYLSRDDWAVLALGNSPLRLPTERVHAEVGARLDIYVRPASICLAPLGPQALFSATVVAHAFQGDWVDIHLDVPALGQARLVARYAGADALRRWPVGAAAGLTFDCAGVCAFAADPLP